MSFFYPKMMENKYSYWIKNLQTSELVKKLAELGESTEGGEIMLRVRLQIAVRKANMEQMKLFKLWTADIQREKEELIFNKWVYKMDSCECEEFLVDCLGSVPTSELHKRTKLIEFLCKSVGKLREVFLELAGYEAKEENAAMEHLESNLNGAIKNGEENLQSWQLTSPCTTNFKDGVSNAPYQLIKRPTYTCFNLQEMSHTARYSSLFGTGEVFEQSSVTATMKNQS